MSRAPRTAVTDALHDVAALGGFFALGVADDRPQVPFAAGEFIRLADDVARRCGTDEVRIGASLAHLALAARLWSPVLACTVLHGIVPDLAGAEWADGGPDVRLHRPGGWYADRLPDPAAAVYEQVDGVLAAVEKAVESAAGVKVARGLLDGNVASALVGSAGVLLRARPGVREPLTRLTRELLGAGRLAGTGRLTGPVPHFRRTSCCLYYRVPGGGKCGDCCLN
ncbi:(2Fe-2S)-binding protein [Streptomyces sp. NPDC050095]|uniref:(2Fe-2S)-binding protein n=1 Tax=unclassified Streptomyces TaxID=2593676 RepID=UPI003427F462